MVFLGLKGDGTLFGYTKLQIGMNSQAYHTLLQHRVLPEVLEMVALCRVSHGNRTGHLPMQVTRISSIWQGSLGVDSLPGALSPSVAGIGLLGHLT